MRRYAITWLVAWVAVLAGAQLSQAADTKESILVIANKSVTTTTLAQAELRPMFQTKKNTWPDGSALKAFNLPEVDSIRRGFDAAVLGLDPDRVVRYWIDRKIRGGDRPPQTAPSAAVMVKLIGKTPGAIGYVDSRVPLDGNVKVVARIIGGLVVAP